MLAWPSRPALPSPTRTASDSRLLRLPRGRHRCAQAERIAYLCEMLFSPIAEQSRKCARALGVLGQQEPAIVAALARAMDVSADELTRYEACKALAQLGLYGEGLRQLYFHYLTAGTPSIRADILATIERTWRPALVRSHVRDGWC